MSAERVVYSIQQTYIIKPVSKSEKRILTCDQRIDIPTIEPLPSVKPVSLENQTLTVIPCIELAGELLSEFNLTFETNEGVTVLPVVISEGYIFNIENPYMEYRYVLVLPRGATGVKSCKLIHKATGKEVQHNFTFGIMPPPYNYDNALFGYSTSQMYTLYFGIIDQITKLKLTSVVNQIDSKELHKNQGEQIIEISDDMISFTTVFSYPDSSEETLHHPVIKVDGKSYTLSLNRARQYVVVDLLTKMITVSDSVTSEVIQQFIIPFSTDGFDRISFSNFDDINGSILFVDVTGRPVG